MPQYTWLTFVTARQQLASRLADSSNVFWTDAENGIYIQTALRQFNALTFTWKADFQYSSDSLWNSLATLDDSPRIRTVTDTECYTLMQYMLLEPPTGGTWTGTTQFSIADLSQALQRRRDEILMVSNCNQTLLTQVALVPGTRRTTVGDTVLDIARVRYQAFQAATVGTAASGASIVGVASTSGIAVGQLIIGTGIAYSTVVTSVGTSTISLSQPASGAVSGTLQFFACNTLFRDDVVAQEFYEEGFWQAQSGTPNTFMLTAEPPLSWDVDVPPQLPGYYEAITLQSGDAFDPPTSTLLNIPDDLFFVAVWGALGDLLGRESEATDRERAAYCMKRYQDGLNLLLNTPWIMLGKVDGVAVNIDSFFDSDRYMPEWDSNPSGFGPVLVSGGIDFIAGPTTHSIALTCLGNAPIPAADGDFVQVARSDWDTVLDLAQCVATFKQGGAEFQQALQLEARAIQACAAENSRLKSFGCFSDVILQRGKAQDRSQERYQVKQQS